MVGKRERDVISQRNNVDSLRSNDGRLLAKGGVIGILSMSQLTTSKPCFFKRYEQNPLRIPIKNCELAGGFAEPFLAEHLQIVQQEQIGIMAGRVCQERVRHSTARE